MSDWREEWREANRAHWDERVPIHVGGEFYDVAGFKAGSSRKSIYEKLHSPGPIWAQGPFTT